MKNYLNYIPSKTLAGFRKIRALSHLPLRGLASKSARWAIDRCPRDVLAYLDRNRVLITRLLPDEAKEYLKSLSKGAKADNSLLNQLNEFIKTTVENNPTGRVFLIFSGTTFTESEGQRPTRLARELARRGIPVIFAYWKWDTTAAVQHPAVPGVFCLPINELTKSYATILNDARLTSLRHTFLMEYPHPSLLEIVNYANIHGWRTVYDVIDDWEEFKKQGQAFWYDSDLESYLLNNVDLTTVTCDNLKKKLIDKGAKYPSLLPNAFEDWAEVAGQEAVSMEKGRITIGYFGHLTASWFDWSLVKNVAERHKDWLFQIIGYGLDKTISLPENVVLLGKVEHADLPSYAKNWDVAMIPFQQSSLSLAVDPIKIYEYISLQLPTVVTGMPHLVTYPGVFIASDEGEFDSAVETAAKQKLDATAVNSFLNDNRWSSRVDALLELVDEDLFYSAASMAFLEVESRQIRVAA